MLCSEFIGGSVSICTAGQAASRASAAAPSQAPRRCSRSSQHHRVPTSSAGCISRRRGSSVVSVAAVSTPERVTVTDRTPPPPPPEVEVKVVGFGSRGANAISKLVAHDKVSTAELWCLDVDKGALEAAHTCNTLLVPKDDPAASEGKLSVEELQRIVGRGASDAGGRGNINAGTDGAVTFVLAPAAAAPGGAATVLQIVQALRAAGHFTVAAVTRPFAFEGNAKQEQANELITALQQTAHVVAVMEQDVLMQAFGDAQMTVAEATDIADNALEHSVRCILQAVQAKEILKSSRGALMWHGRDLRHFKRIISPPLQQLLTQPGTAVLGRGLASMPAEAAHQMGAAQALMHLSSDAVRAAAESPFLDGALGNASGVLCAINLPPIAQQFDTGAGSPAVLQSMQTADGERRAVHLAAQAAAGALGSLTGAGCQDFVMCAEPRPIAEALGDGSLVQVEATLLVLRSPDGQQTSSAGAAGTRRAAPQQQQFSVGPAVPSPPRQPQRLPSSSWNMLSAMAGGSAAAAAGKQAVPQQQGQQERPAQGAQQQQQAPSQQQQQRNIPNFFGGGRRLKDQQQPDAPAAAPAASNSTPLPAAAATALARQQQQQRVPVQRPDKLPSEAAAGSTAPPADSFQQQAGSAGDQQQRMTVGDYLVNSLTAQSLDLPPAAALWRQEHRSDAFKDRKLIVWEVDEIEPWEEEEEPQGLAALLPVLQRDKKRVNIKERMASILMQDREDAWEAERRSMDEQ